MLRKSEHFLMIEKNDYIRFVVQVNGYNMFQKAVATAFPIKMLIPGVNGSGKTFTALTMAKPFGRIAVIDAEFGASQRYANEFEFDIMTLDDKSPDGYIAAIDLAIDGGYDVIVPDSISPEWQKVLEIGEKMGDKFNKWLTLTPMHNRFLSRIWSCPIPIIATVQRKTAYVLELNENGKNVPRKIGMEPVQRDGIYGLFDVVLEMDENHVGYVSKTRFPMIDSKLIDRPTSELMEQLIEVNSAGMPFVQWQAQKNGKKREKIVELAKSIYPDGYDDKINTYCEKVFKKPFSELVENELYHFLITLQNKTKQND